MNEREYGLKDTTKDEIKKYEGFEVLDPAWVSCKTAHNVKLFGTNGNRSVEIVIMSADVIIFSEYANKIFESFFMKAIA